MRSLLIVLFALAVSVSARADAILVNGEERLYLIDGAGEGPQPLIIALHGSGGSAKRFRRTSALLDPAVAQGFVVVWPESDGGNWNDGRIAPNGELVSNSNDEAFILALVQSLKDRKLADGRHVFITGHSNGGMMSFAMGCKYPNVFKAIAPVSANVPRPMDCKGKGPISVLNIVGLKDRVVPFDGGGIFGRKRRGELMSAGDGFLVLKKRNGCTGEIISDTRVAGIFSGVSCKARTEQVQIRRQGHSWPKSEAPGIVDFFASQVR